MQFEPTKIVVSTFKEHPITDYRNEEPHPYDVSAIDCDCEPDFRKNNCFNLHTYCACLVQKLVSIPLAECRPFVEYQCKRVKEPCVWLKQLESLIDQNHDVLVKEYPRYAKLYAVVETLSEKFQTCNTTTPLFDFKKLKSRLETLDTYEEKLKVLIEEKTEFLQHNILNTNASQDCFVKQIELEISKVIDLQAISGQIKGQTKNLTFSEPQNKLKLNGNINILVDAFYQGMRELTIDGKPYIDGSIKEVAEAICTIFTDKNGQELSTSSVQTILSPSKHDKRPKSEKRIKLNNTSL
jgi:hypothetical protein